MTFDISRYDIKANAVIDSEPVNFGEEDMTEEEMIQVEAESLDSDAEPLYYNKEDGDDSWLPEWYLQKFNQLREMDRKIAQQAQKMRRTLKNRLRALSWKYQERVEAQVKRELEEENSKRKTKSYFGGTFGWSNKLDKVRVVDVEKFRAWFEEQPEEIRAKLQDCWDIKLARTRNILEYVQKTGEEIPGVRFIEGEKAVLFSHRTEIPTDLELPRLED